MNDANRHPHSAELIVNRIRIFCFQPTRGKLRELLIKPDIPLIEAEPHTGRLHQIRATLLALGTPIVGDKLYGVDETLFLRFCKDTLTDADRTRLRMERQALHASGLSFRHPKFGRPVTVDLDLPDDMQRKIFSL